MRQQTTDPPPLKLTEASISVYLGKALPLFFVQLPQIYCNFTKLNSQTAKSPSLPSMGLPVVPILINDSGAVVYE